MKESNRKLSFLVSSSAGLDRHLLGLRVISDSVKLKPPALLVPETPALLTAQAPLQRGKCGNKVESVSHQDFFSKLLLVIPLFTHAGPGGGFGLQAGQHSFAVSYLVKEDNFYFHITARPVRKIPR